MDKYLDDSCLSDKQFVRAEQLRQQARSQPGVPVIRDAPHWVGSILNHIPGENIWARRRFLGEVVVYSPDPHKSYCENLLIYRWPGQKCQWAMTVLATGLTTGVVIGLLLPY